MTKLTVPCHWDKGTLNKITSFPTPKHIVLGELYGVLAKGGPVGHGRSSSSVKNISREAAVDFRQHVQGKGVGFVYLLNAPWKADQDLQVQAKLDEYLNWVSEELRPDAVTIASTDLMEEVRKRDTDIAIHISTIAGVRTPQDLERFLYYKPNRVVLHHDLGKNIQQLRKLTEASKRHGLEVELLVTESCLYNCPSREAHYRSLIPGSPDGRFHTVCNTKKLHQPAQFLMAGGTTRPEDLRLYEEAGVNYIKISGRSKPAGWLPEVVEAYLNRNYEGNLVRLLGIDPSMQAEDWIYIDNKGLDGFLEDFPHNLPNQGKLHYCQKWISKLYREGRFYLRDGSTFSQDGQDLCLNCVGDRAAAVINGERKP